MKISIEYCQKWNYKPRASSLEEELKEKFGAGTDVELIAGSNGIFEIKVDGKVIFSKARSGRFPDDGEVAGLIGQWKERNVNELKGRTGG